MLEVGSTAAVDTLQAPCSSALLQVQQDRKLVEGYLLQSLPYLEDSQASLRHAAVRFICEPNPCVPLWALPWQEGTALNPQVHPAHAASPSGCLAQVPFGHCPCLQHRRGSSWAGGARLCAPS